MTRDAVPYGTPPGEPYCPDCGRPVDHTPGDCDDETPDDVALTRYVVAEWWVVTADDGIAYTIGVNEFDARTRADHWVETIQGSHLERVTTEHWHGSRQLSREAVA